MYLITDPVLLDIIAKMTVRSVVPKRRQVLPKEKEKEYVISYYFNDTPDYIMLLYYRETWLTIYSLSSGDSYIAKSMFGRELFLNGGTVLVGNISDNYFILSDVVQYQGRKLEPVPVRERMTILNSIYSHHVTRNAALDPYILTINDFQDGPRHPVDECFKHFKGWLFQGKISFVVTDAVVDTTQHNRLTKPVLDQTVETMFKISYIDVDQYQLSRDGHPYELAVIPDLKTSRYMRSIIPQLPLQMICGYNPVMLGWIPNCQRLKMIN